MSLRMRKPTTWVSELEILDIQYLEEELHYRYSYVAKTKNFGHTVSRRGIALPVFIRGKNKGAHLCFCFHLCILLAFLCCSSKNTIFCCAIDWHFDLPIKLIIFKCFYICN